MWRNAKKRNRKKERKKERKIVYFLNDSESTYLQYSHMQFNTDMDSSYKYCR